MDWSMEREFKERILRMVKHREFIKDQLRIEIMGYECPDQRAVIGILHT